MSEVAKIPKNECFPTGFLKKILEIFFLIGKIVNQSWQIPNSALIWIDMGVVDFNEIVSFE